MKLSGHTCIPTYDDTKRNTYPFGLGSLGNETLDDKLSATSWTYTEPTSLDGVPHWGKVSMYEGGGYIADLTINKNISSSLVDELIDYHWIDRYSRAVMIEFTIYNANVNLFAFTTLLLEFTETGDSLRSNHVDVIQVYSVGIQGIMTHIVEACFVALVFYYLIITCLSIFKYHCIYMKDYRSWLDILLILTSIYATCMYIIRYQVLRDTMAVFRADKEQRGFLQFRSVSTFNTLYVYGLGLLSILSCLRFMTLLRLQKDIAKLGAMLQYTSKPLFSFSIQLAVMLLAFASITHLWYMANFQYFSSFTSSCISLVSFGLGSLHDLDEMALLFPTFTYIFYIGFILMVNLILLSIFIAVIIDGYETFKDIDTLQSADHELLGAIGIEVKKYLHGMLSEQNDMI